ncbi:MAG: MalY/PatB family protein [Bacilli bacterium]
MTINFDETHSRIGTDCLKWDGAEAQFGAPDLLPMWVADMDFRVPEPVLLALRERVEHGIFGYYYPPGQLVQSIIDWWGARYSLSIDPAWLVQSPGVVPSLSVAVRTYTAPGDRVLIQTPAYPPFFNVIGKNGRQVVQNPLHVHEGRYAVDFEDLETKFSQGVKMMILCSPHNPVGRVWTREELLRLGELCLRRDVLLVSDEIHADLVFSGHTHIPFTALADELAQRSIVFAAPSKTFNIAGLHKSYGVIPNATLRQQFRDELGRLALTSENVLSAAAMQAAYAQGAPWLDEALAYMEGNLDWLEAFVQTRMRGAHMTRPQGTHLVWLDFRAFGMDAQRLQSYIVREARVALSNGKTFGANGEGFLRMNIACPRATLQTGAERIAAALDRLL